MTNLLGEDPEIFIQTYTTKQRRERNEKDNGGWRKKMRMISMGMDRENVVEDNTKGFPGWRQLGPYMMCTHEE